MPQTSCSIHDKEANKFFESQNILKTIDCWVSMRLGNKIIASYPSATEEEYSFTEKDTDGTTDVQVFRLKVTYVSSSKEQVSEVERTA